ncbi:MAG: hypothetical protein HDS35_00180 [Bacteroides sp.]|nr:hypothetical protein [Bacteroides sp.]
MEYFNGQYCISRQELVDGGIISPANYDNWVKRDKISIVRAGKGLGNYALIAVDSIPEPYRSKVAETYAVTPESRYREWLKSNYEVDAQARDFYFSPEKCGYELPPEKAREYVTNASVLNTCIRLYDNAAMRNKVCGKRYDWSMMLTAVNTLRDEYGHTLPTNIKRFQKKVNEYRKDGYACLISGKFGNNQARKVDFKTERLILSLAILKQRPWKKDVHMYYTQFVKGDLAVWDYESGELLDRANFTDKNGNPLELSEKTIDNYLTLPKNQVLIRHKLDSFVTFMHETKPHVHRRHGQFSLSKVSFDDRDLPRKLKDTKQRPKAYYAYDVTSGCCIGYAYSRSKNVDLVVEMFRNMFRLLDRNGWGCPAEVEVENHLMSQWRGSFLKEGEVFPFVRFCAPQNSQEKHAEHRNGGKKRTIEHRNHYGIGRFFAKKAEYRTESVKVFDEMNNTYVEKEYYTWDELIAEDMKDIEEYNCSLHENQKKYPGMSRWEVFRSNINPTLKPLDKAVLARYIGEKVSTTIRRNSYCRVEGRDWWLGETKDLERLAPGNYKCDAFYLTDEKDEITDMYLYQNDKLISKLTDPGTFCTARAEQTEDDLRVFGRQRKMIKEFMDYVEENAISSVGMMKAQEPDDPVEIETVTVEPIQEPEPALEPLDTEEFEMDLSQYGNAGLMAV